jgi:hypothetical protein
MAYRPDTPFDSIEGAQEYLTLLAEVIAETRVDVQADSALMTEPRLARRHDAMLVVGYKLERLECHVAASQRLLNDLRLLRRLLLSERPPAASPAAIPRVPPVDRQGRAQDFMPGVLSAHR